MRLVPAADAFGHEATGSAGVRWLRRWHLLSLDAPTVAACWCWLAQRTLAGAASPALAGAMFLAVWLVYALDRLLDARAEGADRRPRHTAHGRYRSAFLIAGTIALPLLALVSRHLQFLTLRRELILATALLLWMAAVHLRPAWPLPKEVAVGVFFGAAVLLPVGRRAAVPWAACFGLLCMVNALFIRRWEEGTAADALTRVLLARVRMLATVALAAPLLLAGIAGFLELALPLSLAACLLLQLDRAAPRVEPTTLRALADAALLTPLLALPWLALRAR